MRYALRWAPLAVLIFLLSSCFSYQEVTFKGISDLDVSRFDNEGIAVRAMATLDNPNNFRIHVMDPQVDLFLNDVYIGKAVLDSSIVMEKRTSKDYPVPMHATFDGHGEQAMMAMLGAALTGKAKLRAKGTVTGKAFLFKKKFPFDQEQTFDLGDR
jgi:LEA14-like dessication related protein